MNNAPRVLLIGIAVVGVATMLFVSANLYYRTQLLYIAQEAAEYGLNQAYLFGMRRQSVDAVVEANVRSHIQSQLTALGIPGADVKFTTKVQNGFPHGTATIAFPALNIIESATVIESASIPPYMSCFALSTGGPWRGAYAQIPTIAGGPWNGSTSVYVGSMPMPADGTIGPGGAYLDTNIAGSVLDAPHRYDEPTEKGWEY